MTGDPTRDHEASEHRFATPDVPWIDDDYAAHQQTEAERARVPEPYYADDTIELHHGDMREVLPALRQSYDLVVADPPFQETSLEWDRWPDGWPALVADVTSSMWAFGSMRMFLARFAEFDPYWNLSQDIVWEKQNGTGFATDRFKRVHEHAVHWYRGAWGQTHHVVPRTPYDGPDKHARARTARTPHTGDIGAHHYEDDGTRLTRSVIEVASVRGGISETQKPVGLITTLIEYACPPGGIVCDPFAGSGSTLIAARNLGRRAVGIEAREEQCEKAAAWLAQGVLEVSS